jgi:hypothetical protein
MYEVNSCGNKDPSEPPYGMLRTFYIAVEEIEWDYAPKVRKAALGRRRGKVPQAKLLWWECACSVDIYRLWKLTYARFCLHQQWLLLMSTEG